MKNRPEIKEILGYIGAIIFIILAESALRTVIDSSLENVFLRITS